MYYTTGMAFIAGKFLSFCKRSFNPHTLQGKMFFICMVISSGIVIIASQIITRSAVKIITDNAYNNIRANIRYADARLAAFLEDGAAICLAISSNRNLIVSGLEDNSPPASYSAFEIRKEVEEYLLNIKVNKVHISMTAVIGLDGKSFQSGGSLLLKKIVNEPWFTDILLSPGYRIYYNTPDFSRVMICRPIIIGREVLGVAVTEMDHRVLGDVYRSAPLEPSRVTAVDKAGTIVFTNYDSGDSSGGGPEYRSFDAEQHYRNRGGEKELVIRFESSFNQLTTIGLVPYGSLIRAAWPVNSLMLVIVFVSVIAAALASWVFSRVFCKKIYMLEDSMLRIQEGDMEVRSRIKSRDEIGVMAAIFNTMMDRIALLLKNIKETEEQKRRAEQIALEAQIQPHFLYNTINSITYVAHERKEKELEAVASATVRLLRGVLGVRESLIPLSQEYDYIEQYLVIQRFKLGRDFRLDWDVEEELWSYPIPKLILQPIVENAMLHGIARKKNGRIIVQVFRRKDSFIMKVIDNGAGMNPLGADANNALTTEPCGGFRKVGIANVRERLALIYGEPFGVEITSVSGVYTQVELVLPLGSIAHS